MQDHRVHAGELQSMGLSDERIIESLQRRGLTEAEARQVVMDGKVVSLLTETQQESPFMEQLRMRMLITLVMAVIGFLLWVVFSS